MSKRVSGLPDTRVLGLLHLHGVRGAVQTHHEQLDGGVHLPRLAGADAERCHISRVLLHHSRFTLNNSVQGGQWLCPLRVYTLWHHHRHVTKQVENLLIPGMFGFH